MPEYKIKFDEVKANFPILKVCDLLGIKLKYEKTPSGEFYRGECPFCQRAKSFRVTPEASLWGCFACRDEGDPDCRGDQIHLVKKLKNFESMKKAAEWLIGDAGGTVQKARKADRSNNDPCTDGGVEPLGLDAEHADVRLLGFRVEDAKGIGIGFSAEHGTVLIPIRLEDGHLAGYIGAADITLPERWIFPSPKVVPLRRKGQ